MPFSIAATWLSCVVGPSNASIVPRAEITPIRIRARANGFSTCANWLFNYAVVQLAPIMINTIAWKTYFVFFCFNLCFIPIVSVLVQLQVSLVYTDVLLSQVYFFFPEPNGWKLETLDEIFHEAHSKGENPVFTEKRWRKNGWQRAADVQAQSSGQSEKSASKKKRTGEQLEYKRGN